MMNNNLKRFVIYFGGMVSVSFGIVLCAECGLGISPISGIPFVLKEILPLSFGQLTMMFHLINTILQILILKKISDIKVLLQIPIAFVFGGLIDLIKSFLVINQESIWMQGMALGASIVFTAIGMVMMVRMNLVQNPPDGLVRVVSISTGVEFGKVKIFYDVTCAVITIVIGTTFLHQLYGIGIATVASALFVGRFVSAIGNVIDRTRFDINKLE